MVVRRHGDTRANLGKGPLCYLYSMIFHALMQHYDTEIIRGLQQGLKAAGRNSLAFTLSMGLDNRHGSYECATPHRYLFADALAEGMAWLQWLKARDEGPVVMLGHSLGANQALGLTVERYDPQISALALLSVMTMGRERLLGNYKMRYRIDLEGVSNRAKALVAEGKGGELMSVDFHICPQTQVAAKTFLDYYGGEPLHADPSSHLGKVTPPVFIVAGSADERQPNVAAFLERFVDEKKVFLYTVDSADHFFRDLNLDEAVEETLGFLAALDGGV